MNQSEFKVNACNQRQAQENACERGTIGFGLASHWLRKVARLVNQSQSTTKQNQSKRAMGPLQLAVTWYKIHHAGEQATHWDMQNKENANLS